MELICTNPRAVSREQIMALIICMRFAYPVQLQCIITISFEEFPAVHLRPVPSMQFTHHRYNDSISLALAIFYSSFPSVRR
jgi:hypothetical protein